MEFPSVRLVLLLLIALSYCCCCCLCHSPSPAASPPDFSVVCAGSRAPVMLGEALSFCGYTGISCCDAVDDAAIMDEFHAMMSRPPQPDDATCAASTVKAALCAIRCGPSLSSNSTASPQLLCASTTANASHHADGDVPPQQPQGTICLERVAEGAFLGMAAHPDGSGRVFLSTEDGRIWLASVPAHGALQINYGASPFLDLADRVVALMGVAFHPEFATNGRFFVSYTCAPSRASPTCGFGTWCPSAPAGNGSVLPCQYQLIVAEFSAQGAGDYTKATRGDPSEVRRIFAVGLPQQHNTSYSVQDHGGQILFRPSDSDGYLYLITGNGGAHGQSYSSSQSQGSFLGKIVRFDVDHSRPEPEIFAAGVSDPRGCSFDSDRPSYLYCADVDEQQYEQVRLISNEAAGNGTASSATTTVISPVVGHGRPAAGRSPSIVGGLVYRGCVDPSLSGRYIYMYDSSAWAATETPGSSGRYAVTRIPNIMCSRTSPVPCNDGGIIGGRVVSFGQDNRKDAFFLATDGVYQVARHDLCGAPPPPQPPPSASRLAWVLIMGAFSLAFAFCLVYVAMFAGGGLVTGSCNDWCGSAMCCVRMTHNGGGRAENRA